MEEANRARKEREIRRELKREEKLKQKSFIGYEKYLDKFNRNELNNNNKNAVARAQQRLRAARVVMQNSGVNGGNGGNGGNGR